MTNCWTIELQDKPSMASLGVLKPRPTFFQNLLPPLPGLFPLAAFFELQHYTNETMISSSLHNKIPRTNLERITLLSLTRGTP